MLNVTWKIVIILAAVRYQCIYAGNSHSKISTFLTSFVNQRMSHCTLVFVFHERDRHYEQETHDTLESLSATTTQGIYIRKLYSEAKEFIPTPFPPESYDVYKQRDHCVVPLFVMHETTEGYLRLSLNLIKSYMGIFTKDKAYFILLSHQRILDTLLITEDFGMKIKYKIGLAVDSNEPEIIVKSNCFYCNFGKPLIFNVDMMEGPTQFNPISKIYPDLIRNFHGKRFRVCQAKAVIWLGEIRQKDGVWSPARGHYYNVLFSAMNKYNFTGSYFPSDGGGTGVPDKNGVWGGTIGHVSAGECDIGQSTARSWARNRQVGFSFAVTYERLTFTYMKPIPYFSWKAIIWPLNNLVWALVLIAFSMVILTFVLMARFTKVEDNAIRRYKSGKYKQLWKIFEYVFGSIVEQGPIGPTIFPSHSLRLVSAIWLVFVMIIGTAYRSKLINLMAFPILDSPPQTFEELAKSDYMITLQTVGGAALHIFRTSTNPTYQTIYQRMALQWDPVKCFQGSGQAKSSCIGYEACMDFAIHKNLTDRVGQVKITRPNQDVMAITTVQITFEYYAIFSSFLDFVIHWSHDSGLILKYIDEDHEFIKTERRQWEAETNISRFTYEDLLEDGSGALSVTHVICSFYLLFLGLVLSSLVFGWEKLVQTERWRKVKARFNHPIIKDKGNNNISDKVVDIEI